MIRHAIRDRKVILAGQVAIALFFLVAGLAKIGEAGAFARQIGQFQLVPLGLENLVAITLPWIELVAALAVLSRVQPRSGAAVIAALMVLFWIAVASAVARGLDIECGCFGTSDATRVGLAKLLENTVLTGIALVACQRPRE